MPIVRSSRLGGAPPIAPGAIDHRAARAAVRGAADPVDAHDVADGCDAVDVEAVGDAALVGRLRRWWQRDLAIALRPRILRCVPALLESQADPAPPRVSCIPEQLRARLPVVKCAAQPPPIQDGHWEEEASDMHTVDGKARAVGVP